MGHPTVAFTESQVYNLLHALANETMSLTYTTIERMILDAMKRGLLQQLRLEPNILSPGQELKHPCAE